MKFLVTVLVLAALAAESSAFFGLGGMFLRRRLLFGGLGFPMPLPVPVPVPVPMPVPAPIPFGKREIEEIKPLNSTETLCQVSTSDLILNCEG
jgi:hypothetical protein